MRALGNSREASIADRKRETTRIDGLISIIALGACLIALAACAIAYYLSASV
ncbi:MAG TPA: hypothetical protein VEZ19_09250 [Rubrobacter sp.]|nr:hypothetical protein [Rubrobacter sp.]